MTNRNWEPKALSSLQWFAENPEFKGEFGHQYFVDNLEVSRMTLNRSKKYMKRYREVKEILKGYQSTEPNTGPAPVDGMKQKLASKNKQIEDLKNQVEKLQLRLNDCYQMLEDHNIDPQFVYTQRLKKHREV